MKSFNKTSNKLTRPKCRSHPTIQLDVSFGDLYACFGAFFHLINRQNCLNEIKSFWHTDKEILVTLSVRTSLDLLLRSLNLPPESEVLMSAVNIREMAEIIRSHGLIPVPIDIYIDTVAPNLELLEQLVSPRSKVLLIAHLFGIIIPLQPYADFCKKHHILLVEDCAQAFAGKQYYGYPQADVSLFSFGAIKSCTALGGAVALIKDKQLAQKIEAIEQTYLQKSEFWYFKRIFKFYLLKLLSLPSLYYQIINLMRLLNLDVESTIKKATLGFPTGDILAKIRYRTPKHLLWFLNYRLRHCDNFEERIQRGKSFLEMLPKNLTIPGNKAEYNSFWVMPILIDSPDTMATKLRAEGFDSARGNRSLFAIDAKPNTANHLLPIQSQYLMAHILCVPFSDLLTVQELEYLAQLITVNIDCEIDETKNVAISK
ncbi:aminotransferase class V-fold PLP-dependent enzyme [Calothrix sp. CCY 0018]|uniref:aminotransferase class V-fold PLP-dependent enzyme n=1 Tax=Calothrix sp. CCY 0018 TaxID=3103864 RepID=UPI0039C7581F